MPMADGYIVPYNLTTVSNFYETDTTVQLQHYVFSLAVQNLSSNHDVTVYINKYTNDSVIVPPNSYKEIAVTTDWYKIDFETGHDKGAVVDRVETEDPDLLMTPLFPNLYQSKNWTLTNDNDTFVNTEFSTTDFFVVTKNTASNVGYSYLTSSGGSPVTGTLSGASSTSTNFAAKLYSFTITDPGPVTVSVSGPVYNAINSGGYTYTPWSTSDGATSVLGADSVVKVDYYLNGVKTTKTNTSNFYATFANDIFSTVNSFYPAGYTPGENQSYDPVQFADVIVKTRNFFDSIKATSIHDQYIGGWAQMTTFNKDLSIYEFTLLKDGTATETPGLELPFTAIAFTATRVSGTSVGYSYVDASGATITGTFANDTVPVMFNSMKSFTLTSNGSVKLTFSGNLLKLIDFAPIINIVYPLGFDEVSGKPLTEYQSYTTALTTFHNQLANNKFTGRVIYFKSIPFGLKEPADVWNADYIIPEYMPPAFKLVFPDIQDEVYNWYARSNMESDLIKVIAWENKSLFYHATPPVAEPASLLDVISNDSITVILGETVTGADSTERSAFKRSTIKKFLLKEYNGAYSMGGLNFYRFGFTV